MWMSTRGGQKTHIDPNPRNPQQIKCTRAGYYGFSGYRIDSSGFSWIKSGGLGLRKN